MAKYGEANMGQYEAGINMCGGMDGYKRFLNHEFILVDPASKKGQPFVDALFAFAGTFSVPGTKSFAANENYVVNTSEGARVRIRWLGDNFKKYLLPKIEPNIEAANLNLQKLRRLSIDLPKNAEEPGTIAGLGGLDKAEVSLYDYFEALAHKQSVDDFSWLVGYVRDDNGVLWAVNARWNDDGWNVEAGSPDYPYGWDAGSEFLSR